MSAVFVDTNVLVYSRDSTEPVKQARANAWRKALWRSRAGRLSVQVLEEYYVTVTRKLSPGMPRKEARAEVEDLSLWQPVDLSTDLVQRAFGIEDRFRLSFWDAMIVAAASCADCEWLLTEDLQAKANYGGVRVVNPFETSPEELLADR